MDCNFLLLEVVNKDISNNLNLRTVKIAVEGFGTVNSVMFSPVSFSFSFAQLRLRRVCSKAKNSQKKRALQTADQKGVHILP